MPNQLAYPRPEYPRPDRQRGHLEGVDWLNLNGPWQFRFDRDKTGLDQEWYRPDDWEWREQIIVPFCWESLAAWGEAETASNTNYFAAQVYRDPLNVTLDNHRSSPRYEVGWYRRRVIIPHHSAWENKRVILIIGAADFFTDAWCNGQFLGHHEGGYTPFEFDITDALSEPDEQGRRSGWLVLRVEDPMENHEQPVGKQWRWYTTTSGIWQTVYIEPRSPTHLHAFRLYPEIETSQIRLALEIERAQPDCRLEAEIIPPEGESYRIDLDAPGERVEGRLPVRPLKLWCPNFPHLYDMILRLKQGEVLLDEVHTYFGMRKIDVAPATDSSHPAVRLNGKIRYLRGALYQSYHPDGVYTAGSVHVLKRDLELTRQFGFNMLRIHIKIDDPLLLYYADKMGVLLMADFPNFGEGGDTVLGRNRFETMMREAMARDFNHPAIFAWCMFNETWGFGGQVELVKSFSVPKEEQLVATEASEGEEVAIQPVIEAICQERAGPAKLANRNAQAWVQSMWELAKQIDPTRLIEDMSVCYWEHLDYYGHGDTDVNSWHFYINDYERAKAHLETVVESTFEGSTFNYVEGYQHKGQPLINSEYGGIGALDGDKDVSWSFKFLTNELRRHEKIAAYIYTEHHDVEWERNGFLNYDRTIKDFGYDPTIINHSNTLPLDAPPIQRVKFGAHIQVPVSSSHYSTLPYPEVYLQWRLAGFDTRGHLHADLEKGMARIDFPHQRVALARVLELTMPDLPMLCSLDVEAVTPHGHLIARNFIHFLVSEEYPASREELPRTLVLRARPGEWSQSQWSGGESPRDLHITADCCWGEGYGYYEWDLPLNGADLRQARRIRVMCEASSHRIDTPQTGCDLFPTEFRMLLNEVRIFDAELTNHPHDARGVLSYLRGGCGAYGYLARATVEGPLLSEVIQKGPPDHIRLRCAVPADCITPGGLTIYGADCGRYPICPMLIVEW